MVHRIWTFRFCRGCRSALLDQRRIELSGSALALAFLAITIFKEVAKGFALI